MDSELVKLLEENLKVSKANNHILKELRRAQRFGYVVKFVYWIVIIVALVGGYTYFLQPLLKQTTATYEGLTGITETTNSLFNVFEKKTE